MPPPPRARDGRGSRRQRSRRSPRRGCRASAAAGRDRDDRGDAARSRGHDDDPVGEEDRLGDAVGDDHDRRRRPLPQLQQLEIEPLAGQRVEGAERLVEEQHLRLEREGPGDRRALAHPAGELARSGARRLARARRDRAAAASRSAWRARGQPASSRGYVTLPATDRHGRRRGSWKTSPTRGSGPTIGSSSRLTAPRSGRSSPAATRRNVLLPQPFGPIRATISPRSTVRLERRRAPGRRRRRGPENVPRRRSRRAGRPVRHRRAPTAAARPPTIGEIAGGAGRRQSKAAS